MKYGNIADLDSLRDGTAQSDGVIHLAFNRDFSQFEKNAAKDRKAIEAVGKVLVGSNRPFVINSGTGITAHFGWLGRFAGHTMPSSSALTQQKLNWKPTGLSLIRPEAHRFQVRRRTTGAARPKAHERVH